jgi:oxygen-independent coproporphyrinogen-3 oxidase
VSDADKLGVYVSVPFCRAKCSFCNFASGVGTGADVERYVGLLCDEIESVGERAAELGAELPRVVDTVYFGGGTPSLLTPEQLGRVFAALRRQFAVEQDAEITLEAAPGQMEESLLDAAMRLGVNRVSLGVQSFVDKECAAVGRLHTELQCVAEIRRLRAAGVREVGADLIAGLPYQTRESWSHSLSVACDVGLTHLSVYMLEMDNDSRLGREVLAGGLRLHAPRVPAEDFSAELYEMACEQLPHAGFEQYEISNFAASEHRSRHNVKYWRREPYVGFGLDAHSMLRRCESAVRWANAEELKQYPAVSDTTDVAERDAFEETVFLGLRMCDGLSLQGLRREWVQDFEARARELVREGLMLECDGRWKLTRRGMMVSNEVFGSLLETVAT